MQVILNKKEKEELVVKLYQENKTIRQIAEIVHMSFKDIGAIIRRIDGRVNNDADTDMSNKSKTARAFELFRQGKQSVEVAIELDMSADEVEELHVQYWRLSKLDDLEDLYHEAKYSLSLLLRLFKILKDMRYIWLSEYQRYIWLTN